jgi:hypothetical protein
VFKKREKVNMSDDLKLPQVGELTLPRWQYWLARYNEVLGERERRIEKLEAALRYYAKEHENPFGGDDSLIASKALEGKDD